LYRYVTGATAVEATWLVDDAPALASLSAPLEDPAPRYVSGRDAVMAFTQPHFGRHRWELPLHVVPMSAEKGGCGGGCTAVASSLQLLHPVYLIQL
jgi:ATP-dependent RNA helicase DHX37/DHR1